jgi:hypothetical protein
MNVLNVLVFYGDNLSVLRDRIAPESVNLFISTRPSTRTPPTMSFSRHHRANSHKRRSRRSGTPGPPRSNVYARKSCCQIGLEQARRPGAVQRLSCVRGLSVSFHAFGLLEQRAEERFYRRLIEPRRALIFDIGASWGRKARIFSKLADQVICVEPTPSAIESL